MRIAPHLFRSIDWGSAVLCRRLPLSTRLLSTAPPPGDPGFDKRNPNAVESAEEFELRIFDDFSGSGSRQGSFSRKLDGIGRDGSGLKSLGGDGMPFLGGFDDRFTTLSDDMDGKLEKAARYFEYDSEEVMDDNYSYRPDMNLQPDMTYEPKDLDLRRPAPFRHKPRKAIDVTTEEVLRKADFRNVRFLANFLTRAGIIIKRSQSGISAKAQRRVAREIKKARAFGLMPFTTMGTKPFICGRTMENLERDYVQEYFDYRGGNDIEED
ncbi:hypothetical protein MLD38_011222 [Melastoma candidum]|uniref:Uncharacterized protein n=1 Tax=Melastoma candidum TaxID=119954 RepID=A0ACB9R5W0_9MYRT|nr:hypothetical protein MLD38_011222 [Melastoma candidum]